MDNTKVRNTVYLSLGSNLGNRESNLREAIRRLGEVGTVRKLSSLYETEPVEVTEQPWFLNCAVELETERSPEQLLGSVLGIESDMGRVRVQPKGPRLIDIDILLFSEQVIDTPELTLPHPAMHERRFVLEPMVEIAPEVRHPVLNKSVRQMLAELPEDARVVRCSW